MPEPERMREDRALLVEIKASFQASDSTYGMPRVHDDLCEAGRRVGRRRVARLMRQAGLRASVPRRFVTTTDSNHRWAVAENVLGRDFTATAPEQKWAADITYVWTDEGWLFLAVVLDLYSRRVVGHAMGKTLERTLVEQALSVALARRGASNHTVRAIMVRAITAALCEGWCITVTGAVSTPRPRIRRCSSGTGSCVR
jgi:putative transposase